ncbi:MAG: hypothetical protein AAF581_10185 [Planctomycetota bacterium]
MFALKVDWWRVFVLSLAAATSIQAGVWYSGWNAIDVKARVIQRDCAKAAFCAVPLILLLLRFRPESGRSVPNRDACRREELEDGSV